MKDWLQSNPEKVRTWAFYLSIGLYFLSHFMVCFYHPSDHPVRGYECHEIGFNGCQIFFFGLLWLFAPQLWIPILLWVSNLWILLFWIRYLRRKPLTFTTKLAALICTTVLLGISFWMFQLTIATGAIVWLASIASAAVSLKQPIDQ